MHPSPGWAGGASELQGVPLERSPFSLTPPRSPHTFPSSLALLLHFGRLHSGSGPPRPGRGTCRGEWTCSEHRGKILSWDLLRGREAQIRCCRNVSVFSGFGFVCALQEECESSFPLSWGCFMAKASKQRGSLQESEIIPGFGIPTQNLEFLKPYPGRGCVKSSNSFIYCRTSVMAFIKLKAETFSIFYLPKSSEKKFFLVQFSRVFFRADNRKQRSSTP